MAYPGYPYLVYRLYDSYSPVGHSTHCYHTIINFGDVLKCPHLCYNIEMLAHDHQYLGHPCVLCYA